MSKFIESPQFQVKKEQQKSDISQLREGKLPTTSENTKFFKQRPETNKKFKDFLWKH